MKKHLTMHGHHYGQKPAGIRGSFRDDTTPEGPSEAAIRNILNYSLALNVVATRRSGTMSLMMN